MAWSNINVEHPNCTRTQTGKERSVDKCANSMWMRLALLFIIILITKGLLITWSTLLLRASLFNEGEEGTEKETSKFHGVHQKPTTLLYNGTADRGSQLCPKRWHWFWGHCYFFSVGITWDKTWAESVEYCAKRNASLAIMKNEAEMAFILGHMSRFSEMPFLWLGLSDSKVEGEWRWLDGTPLQKLNFINIEWDSEDRDCADLRGNGSVFACDCEDNGPWLCKKAI